MNLNTILAVCLVLLALAVIGGGVFVRAFRSRGYHLWLPTYLRERRRYRLPSPNEDVHLLLCICDHYEPHHHAQSDQVADARVSQWVEQYPKLFDQFRDADGRPPRHTFFYPMEQYHANHLDALGELCRAGYGEVEIHLHHDNETSESLRSRLNEFRRILDERHGLLPQRRDSGEPVYAFIHGNWALDNCRSDGRYCGVNNELDILRETGCYADFTFPSAPSLTQPRTINSIYYAVDDPARPNSHNEGVPVGSAPAPANALMLIQGPLVPSWRNPKWGIIPRIENGCLQGNQPATIGRLDDWLRARVGVPSRPDWFFVKIYSHGAPESNARVVLGEPMTRFHTELAQRAADNPRFHVHYVTAREMYNLARAAEAGWTGSVAEARDYELTWNLAASPATPGHATGAVS